MRRWRLLLVEPDRWLTGQLETRLTQSAAYTVHVVSSGRAALSVVGRRPLDALLLETALPDIAATDVCRAVRIGEHTAHLGVILMGERSVLDPVVGLDLGADDYVARPFNVDELEARLRGVLRRRAVHRLGRRPDGYDGRLLEIDFLAGTVEVRGRQVGLTRRQFRLLRSLADAPNQVIDRDTLLQEVWGPTPEARRAIDTAIYRLRKNLSEAGGQIETVPGLGYRFTEPPVD